MKYASTFVLLGLGCVADAVTLSVKKVSVYPGYSGLLHVQSDGVKGLDITLAPPSETSAGTVSITGLLQGLEANAMGGIHIHEGGSNSLGQDCWYAAGHYWENGSVNGTKDVWADSVWRSNSEGIAFVNVTVSNYDPAAQHATVGRVLVVHDSAKNRVACGVIKPSQGADVTSPKFMAQGVPSLLGNKQGVLAGATATFSAYREPTTGNVTLQGWITLNATRARNFGGELLAVRYMQDAFGSNVVPVDATWNAERVFDIKVSEQLGNTIARAAFSFNIGEQDLDRLISINYGRRRLGATGERAAARSLAWQHKYVEVTHPDGSVLRATMGKNCLDGWTTADCTGQR